MTRPGDRLRAFAARWCCDETMTRLIDPLIADLQHEFAQSIRAGERWRSRLIRVGGWIAFAKVIAICTWTSELAPHRWTSDDRRLLARTLALSAVLIIAFTVLNLLTASGNVLRSSHSTGLRLVVYLIPQALPIAVTLGATLGILFGVGGRQFSGRVGLGLVSLALAASAVSFVNMGWILPEANHAYRIATFRRTDLPKGAPELTLGEISRTIEVVRREPIDPSAWHYGDPQHYLMDLRFNYQTRWALSFSPLVFAWLALLMMRGCHRRWLLAIEACGAFLGYYVLSFGGRALFLSGTMPAPVAVWFPNAMFAALAGFLMIRKSRQSTWFYAAPW
jgi:lipopolysaccharide export LptBFGC system permease protein LptF